MPVIFAAKASSLWLATDLIGLAAATHQGRAANLFTLASDMFPKQAVGSVVGLGAMFGSVAAMGFSQLTGFILQTTGSYWPLSMMAGGAYLLALALVHHPNLRHAARPADRAPALCLRRFHARQGEIPALRNRRSAGRVGGVLGGAALAVSTGK